MTVHREVMMAVVLGVLGTGVHFLTQAAERSQMASARVA